MKLVQKRFLKGSKEFEIVDEELFVCIKSLFKEEKLTVDLSTLDPEPVIIGSELAFYSPHKGHPVFTLLLNKPNSEEFNNFIDTLKQVISGEENSFTVETVSPESAQSALARNVYEEPPEFVEAEERREKISFDSVIMERLDNDISMLKTYLGDDRFKPLIDSLETLKAEPQNEAIFKKIMDALNELGVYQGAVLTYAPYLKVLLSKYSWS